MRTYAGHRSLAKTDREWIFKGKQDQTRKSYFLKIQQSRDPATYPTNEFSIAAIR